MKGSSYPSAAQTEPFRPRTPTRNALEKEMKRLTDLGVFSSAGAENELQERAFSDKLKVCQIVHLDADLSVKTSTACRCNDAMPIKRSSDEMAEMPMLKKLKAETPVSKLKAKEPESM